MEVRIFKNLVAILRLGFLSLKRLLERDGVLRQDPRRETLFNLRLVVRSDPIL